MNTRPFPPDRFRTREAPIVREFRPSTPPRPAFLRARPRLHVWLSRITAAALGSAFGLMWALSLLRDEVRQPWFGLGTAALIFLVATGLIAGGLLLMLRGEDGSR